MVERCKQVIDAVGYGVLVVVCSVAVGVLDLIGFNDPGLRR